MRASLESIRELFRARGACQYSSEPVTQLEHALQTAQLAAQSGAARSLIVASLLHDLGHLSNDQGETPTLRGIDDRHQYHGVSVLKGLFADDVLAPIRLHVDAKRYLCATEPGYWDGLSVDSKRSLELQGGMFAPGAAEKFIAQPHARDAVRLRRWDDLAKVAGLKTPDLEHFLKLAAQCAA